MILSSCQLCSEARGTAGTQHGRKGARHQQTVCDLAELTSRTAALRWHQQKIPVVEIISRSGGLPSPLHSTARVGRDSVSSPHPGKSTCRSPSHCLIPSLEWEPVCQPVKMRQIPAWPELCHPDGYKSTEGAAFPDNPYHLLCASALFPLFQPM